MTNDYEIKRLQSIQYLDQLLARMDGGDEEAYEIARRLLRYWGTEASDHEIRKVLGFYRTGVEREYDHD